MNTNQQASSRLPYGLAAAALFCLGAGLSYVTADAGLAHLNDELARCMAASDEHVSCGLDGAAVTLFVIAFGALVGAFKGAAKVWGRR